MGEIRPSSWIVFAIGLLVTLGLDAVFDFDKVIGDPSCRSPNRRPPRVRDPEQRAAVPKRRSLCEASST
jgi:hypothetical protein